LIHSLLCKFTGIEVEVKLDERDLDSSRGRDQDASDCLFRGPAFGRVPDHDVKAFDSFKQLADLRSPYGRADNFLHIPK
jgi:hypothetical protein